MTEFEKLLLAIEDTTARQLLAGLKDPERCTPALIGQAIRYLEKHKVEVGKFEKDESALGDLAAALPPLVTEDEAHGYH